MKISDVVFLFEIGSHFFVTVRATGCGSAGGANQWL